MVPWKTRWEVWFWVAARTYRELWHRHWVVVILAVLGLIFLARLSSSQEQGNYLIMDKVNLACAESYLSTLGHQVKAYEGAVLGEQSAREAGTGTAAIRGRDKNGAWFWWVWQTQKGVMVRLQKYPARAPRDFKGE